MDHVADGDRRTRLAEATDLRCQHPGCNEPAIVHIRHEAANGSPVRHLCLRCAENEAKNRPASSRMLDRSALLIATGIATLFVCVFADAVQFGSEHGLGWRRLAALALTGILMLTGAITRVPTIMVVGLIAGGSIIAGDLLGLGIHPGFGWKQIVGTILGGAVLLLGLLHARLTHPGGTK